MSENASALKKFIDFHDLYDLKYEDQLRVLEQFWDQNIGCAIVDSLCGVVERHGLENEFHEFLEEIGVEIQKGEFRYESDARKLLESLDQDEATSRTSSSQACDGGPDR